MALTFVIGLWIVAGIIIGFATGPARNLFTTPIAFFHVPVAIAMEVGFFLSAIYGALWLRRRQVRDDSLSLAYAEVGFVFAIIATITGSIFSRTNWGEYWSWDPQQMGITAVLLTYAALFALRHSVEEEDTRRNLWAVYAIFGAVAAIFWTFLFRRLPAVSSLHPPDVLRKSDAIFRFALWFNIVGYTLLLIRLAILRARLEEARLTLRARRMNSPGREAGLEVTSDVS